MSDLDGDHRPKSGSLRIVGLVAENVKRIEVVELKPTGDVVEITGKNGSGKTSLLDAIWYAFLLGGRLARAARQFCDWERKFPVLSEPFFPN